MRYTINTARILPFMRNILYHSKIRWTIWTLLAGVLAGLFYSVLHELYTFRSHPMHHHLQSDRLEETSLVSLDNKGNPYRIFAQSIQACSSDLGPQEIRYKLELPKAVMHTPKQDYEIYSQHGTLDVSKALKPKLLTLGTDVTVRSTHLGSRYELQTEKAYVKLEEKKIIGYQPIKGKCDYGTFTGSAFSIDKQTQNLTIKGPSSFHVVKPYPHTRHKKTT